MSNLILKGQSADKKLPYTCEAINCSAKATKKIEVKVGKLGKIFLFVCNNCCHKFEDSESEEGIVQ